MMDLRNVMDLNFLQQFQDSFALSIGVSSLTKDRAGNSLTSPSRFSNCCTCIRNSDLGLKRCYNCDKIGADRAGKTKKPAIYQCHAGFIDFAVPMIVERKQIGTIYGGQILTKQPEEEKFHRVAVEMGVDPDDFLEEVYKIPIMQPELIQAAANVLYVVANTLSTTIQQQIKLREKDHELLLLNGWLDNIVETMSDGIMIIDENGKVKLINRTVEQLLGQTADEIINNSLQEMMQGKCQNDIEKICLPEASTNIETVLNGKTERIHCLITGNSVKNAEGGVSGGIVVLHPMDRQSSTSVKGHKISAKYRMQDIIGKSPAILEAKRIAMLAAKNMSHVLLEGESGTGKEVFAQAIHNESRRCGGPFVAINCGAIPKELIGSELFGYTEGAFTGAKKGGKRGKFELASGGTIFLDEIGDMPLEQQVALLRVLQEKSVTHIGGDRVIPVDVRVICATNKVLLNEVEKGNFRQDLYYRLNVISLTIPPLRNRREDIPLLFSYFLNRLSQEWGRNFKYIESDVMECLQAYYWPGNVRELQNVIERVVNIADQDTIRLEHLPSHIVNYKPVIVETDAAAAPTVKVASEREKWKKMQAEKEIRTITALLARHGGNVSQVARDLGISRNTLYRKMHQYNIAD